MRLPFLILCLLATSATAAPRVVTSILPVQEITAAIMAGVARPEVIIDAHASTHHFALKPSQMRLLQRADLVIWVSRNFESGFYRLAEILPASARQLELLPALGVTASDGHFWYAPDLLLGSVAAIAAALEERDPQNGERYRSNAAALAAGIGDWRDRARGRWRQNSPRVLVDHDFLFHFTRAFELEPIPAVHDQHDDHAGLQKLNRLEAHLREHRVVCLLSLDAEVSPLAAELALKYRLEVVNLEVDTGDTAPMGGILARLERLDAALARCQ